MAASSCQDVGLHGADHMHLAGLAVEFQGVALVAADQGHRLGADLALHALHALGLLRAQVEGEAQAVLGDHQRHLARLPRAPRRRRRSAARRACGRRRAPFVVDVGQVAQLGSGIVGRRLAARARSGRSHAARRAASWAAMASRRSALMDAGRHERLRQRQFRVMLPLRTSCCRACPGWCAGRLQRCSACWAGCRASAASAWSSRCRPRRPRRGAGRHRRRSAPGRRAPGAPTISCPARIPTGGRGCG
jgi:hypothetical protein